MKLYYYDTEVDYQIVYSEGDLYTFEHYSDSKFTNYAGSTQLPKEEAEKILNDETFMTLIKVEEGER